MSRRVKVVRLIARLNVGGPALHCSLLTTRLVDHGFDTVLVAGPPGPGEASHEELFGGLGAGRLVRLSQLRRAPSILGDLMTLFSLLRLLRRERPEILHTHTAKAGVLGRVAATLTGVPVRVHTFHGHVLDGYFSPWASALIAMVERALARVTTAIITLSPRLEVELRERFRIAPANRFRIIPLGRELGALESCAERRGELRAELGLGAEVPLIGCVGRLVPIKDHHTLLEAFAGLSCEVPARLVIVGDGQLGPALEAQAEQLGVGARVHFLGWRSDLPGIYADLDLLALSSRNEGTPLAIIEAFAAGCPVVATRVGGVADLFSDALADEPLSSQARVERRAEGSLVEPGDPEALRAALAAWIADPTGRLRAASAARVAGRQYRAETLAERMAQLYRELLARKELA